MRETTLNKLIDFLNEEICERRDYSASKMCEVIRLKIETELLEEEKEQIINAIEWGNRKGYDEHTLTCIYDEDLKYYNETYTQSSV